MFRSSVLCAIPIFLLFQTGSGHDLWNYPQRSIYNKLTQEEPFQRFAGLVNYNHDARMDLLQEQLTVFVPTNEAFQKYGKPLHSDLAFYHMAVGAWTLKDLRHHRNVSAQRRNFPKLWIARTNDGLFVNNAAIVEFKSDYPGKTRNGKGGKDQMLHVIDEVLDPIIRNPKYSHTALDFLTGPADDWQLDTGKTTADFLLKIRQYQLSHLYELDGSNTYFVPVDDGIDPFKFERLDKNVIFGHIVPNYVLFTRPTARGFNYETMANGDDIYMVLSLEEKDDKLYVKSSTSTDTPEHPKGEMWVEIIEANIPVLNGVLHLVAQPLGIYQRALKPFPYLPVLTKLATDPTLSTMYDMGERTGFNQIFKTHNGNFTYFVPNDFAWSQMKKQGLQFSGSEVELLKRHLIISNTPYTMENLMALSSGRNYTHVELKTVGGVLRLVVLQIEDRFFIRWNRTYIKVIRPNYQCPDGLVHVLAGPIANLN